MAGEREPRRDISRREIIKRTLVGGSMLMGIGSITDLFLNIKKADQIYGEAKRKVNEQGITLPEEEALETAQRMDEQTVRHALKNRSLNELLEARKTLAQKERFDTAVRELSVKKMDEQGPSTKRVIGDIVGLTPLVVAGVAYISRKIENS